MIVSIHDIWSSLLQYYEFQPGEYVQVSPIEDIKSYFNHLLILSSHLQADKVVQLYETMMTRHTTMVVGPTGGGKSVVIKTLAEAQTK